MADPVEVRSNDQLQAGPPTPGMSRAQAFATDTVWVGEVTTDPGTVSGWHPHGENSTYGRVLSGSVRVEFGPSGSTTLEGTPGDYFFVPPHTVHRESNPGSSEHVLAVVRIGSGPSVVNVEGPQSD